MAVYTEVTLKEASALFSRLSLGEPTQVSACVDGVENTNYFVTATHESSVRAYVLTLFERLGADQLPFYLGWMQHLAHHGLPVPAPYPDSRGVLVHQVNGKPAAVVDKLAGRSALAPDDNHCALLGSNLARLHVAGRTFDGCQAHLRGLDWWNATVPVVRAHLTASQQALIDQELAYQNHTAASSLFAALPRGPIHADLFRDNVLFDVVQGKLTLTGMFDFYFAGIDTWLFDLAVCLNDWCVSPATGQHQSRNALSLLNHYESVRPLQAAERQLLAAMLRAAALRFWVSRLWDFYLPRNASELTPRDPSHFEQLLRQRATHPMTYSELTTHL